MNTDSIRMEEENMNMNDYCNLLSKYKNAIKNTYGDTKIYNLNSYLILKAKNEPNDFNLMEEIINFLPGQWTVYLESLREKIGNQQPISFRTQTGSNYEYNYSVLKPSFEEIVQVMNEYKFITGDINQVLSNYSISFFNEKQLEGFPEQYKECKRVKRDIPTIKELRSKKVVSIGNIDLQKKLDELNLQLNASKIREENYEKKSKDDEKEIERLNVLLRNMTDQLKEKQRKDKELEEMRKELNKLKKQKETDEKKYTKEIKQYQDKVKVTEEKAENYTKFSEKLMLVENEKKMLINKNKGMVMELESKENEISKYRRELEKYEQQKQNYSNLIRDAEMDKIQAENKYVNKVQEINMNWQLSQKDKEIALEQARHEKDQEILTKENEINQLKNQLDNLKQIQERMLNDITTRDETIDQLRNKNEEIQGIGYRYMGDMIKYQTMSEMSKEQSVYDKQEIQNQKRMIQYQNAQIMDMKDKQAIALGEICKLRERVQQQQLQLEYQQRENYSLLEYNKKVVQENQRITYEKQQEKGYLVGAGEQITKERDEYAIQLVEERKRTAEYLVEREGIKRKYEDEIKVKENENKQLKKDIEKAKIDSIKLAITAVALNPESDMIKSLYKSGYTFDFKTLNEKSNLHIIDSEGLNNVKKIHKNLKQKIVVMEESNVIIFIEIKNKERVPRDIYVKIDDQYVDITRFFIKKTLQLEDKEEEKEDKIKLIQG